MAERLTINVVTSETKEWTIKVQVVDKGRPRDNLQKTNKYQLMIFQDEELRLSMPKTFVILHWSSHSLLL
ncbi:hypothetical protein H5410_055863 [Solanum commersonii]|uniref:Uncharacterized protein n=1 Tax=Solanum commersonii TaxID=4109 RepID=A0A9J5WIR0_SOLCO|nr:hypothetical protein H5410_055863 [Solanum commersonii]